MENIVMLRIELPKDVIENLQRIITETVIRALSDHVDKVKTEPKLYSRKEVAKQLQVTLPTLRVYELQGRLVPKRAGKRVLYTKQAIEDFIETLRP
jgi:hypothetical protein